MIDLDTLQAEIQSRADALTSSSPERLVREIGIAARSIELAGGNFDRTVLDVELQRVADDVSGSSTAAELISLGAALPRQNVNAASVEVGSYIAGLFKGDPKYLQCNGGTYLRSAYPELSDLALSGLTQQISISATEDTNAAISSSYETSPSIYKFNGKFYKLCAGTSNTSGWLFSPIQVSTDGIVFRPVNSISIASPLNSYSGNVQMDVMIASGTTLLAFGRLAANSANYLIQMRSLDDGKTWQFSTVRGATISYSSTVSPVLAAAIGNTVIAHIRGEAASSIYYSSTFGGSWSTLNDTDAVNSKFINGLVEDGSRFMIGFSDGSSAYTAAADPSGSTWTAVAPPNANARGVLAVVSGKWVMGGASGYVATCTALGTWVAQATCTTAMPSLNIERILVNGSVLAFSQLATGGQVFYCTDASTLPAATAITADAIVSNAAKLVIASIADGNFYIRIGAESVIRSASLSPSSYSSIQVKLDVDAQGSFDNPHQGIIKKYGLYFYSVGGAYQHKRYVSADLKSWRLAPAAIFTGCGAIVDAGTRLLALDDNHLLWQSTDGLTWDSTGITRPTLLGTPYSYYARLYVCENGWIYFVRFYNSDASYQVFVSKNSGSTWSAVSGLGFAGSSSYINVLQNPCLFTEISGKIYSLSVNYFTSGYGYYLYVSSDGINFTYKTGAGNSLSGLSYTRRNGVFKVDGVIYAFASGDTSEWLASYDDGANFITVPVSFVPAIIITIASINSYYIINRNSSESFLYIWSASGSTLVRQSTDMTGSSANYAVGSALVSPAFIYETGVLKMLSQANSARGPILTSLADTNTTFTLPNIANTWLRAAA